MKATLEAQCPAGTALDLVSSVSAGGSTCAATDPGDGSVSSVCVTSGNCTASCKVVLSCQCGASLVARDQVTCNPCSVCGDGKVEPPEQCDLGANNGKGLGCDNDCMLTQGASCGTNGNLRCSPDNTKVQVCTDNLWTDQTTCSASQACDATMLQCVTSKTYCATPGAQQCAGVYQRQQCGPDNRWADAPCPSYAPVCAASGSVAQCQAGISTAVSANYRLNIGTFVVGGIYGYQSSTNNQAELGPVTK